MGVCVLMYACVCVCAYVCREEKGLPSLGGEEDVAGTHRDEVFIKNGVRCGISGDIHGD